MWVGGGVVVQVRGEVPRRCRTSRPSCLRCSVGVLREESVLCGLCLNKIRWVRLFLGCGYMLGASGCLHSKVSENCAMPMTHHW
jgi:hypothetical protein